MKTDVQKAAGQEHVCVYKNKFLKKFVLTIVLEFCSCDLPTPMQWARLPVSAQVKTSRDIRSEKTYTLKKADSSFGQKMPWAALDNDYDSTIFYHHQ